MGGCAPFRLQPGSEDHSAAGWSHLKKTQRGGSGAVAGDVGEQGIQPSVTSSGPAPGCCSVTNCSPAEMTRNSTRPPPPWALAPAPLPQGQVATTMRPVEDWQSCQRGMGFGVGGWRKLGTRMDPQEVAVVVVLLLLARMRVRVSMTLTRVEVSLTNRGYQCFVGMH